ncbi:MAG: hypothetical protein NTX25_14995 [Proteobacteria bacterium]|nr:hypothetical protein [Pseudomonadota bacterium]
MKTFAKFFLLTSLVLSAAPFFFGCDIDHRPAGSTVSTHGTSQYKDVFQLIAAGADCSDLEWMTAHCVSDPEGDWAGNAKGGFCGDTEKSCNYAVATRNRQLACWQDEKVIECK